MFQAAEKERFLKVHRDGIWCPELLISIGDLCSVIDRVLLPSAVPGSKPQ